MSNTPALSVYITKRHIFAHREERFKLRMKHTSDSPLLHLLPIFFGIKQHRLAGLVNIDVCSVLIAQYINSGYWSSFFFKCVYIYLPVYHLKHCQEDQWDRKWQCKDFTSRWPTSINWLIAQQQKSAIRFTRAAEACWSPTLSQVSGVDGWGKRQRTTALKANNLCADSVWRELIVVQT